MNDVHTVCARPPPPLVLSPPPPPTCHCFASRFFLLLFFLLFFFILTQKHLLTCLPTHFFLHKTWYLHRLYHFSSFYCFSIYHISVTQAIATLPAPVPWCYTITMSAHDSSLPVAHAWKSVAEADIPKTDAVSFAFSQRDTVDQDKKVSASSWFSQYRREEDDGFDVTP